jgi:tetratricopeptide (TPR) repeat protein
VPSNKTGGPRVSNPAGVPPSSGRLSVQASHLIGIPISDSPNTESYPDTEPDVKLPLRRWWQLASVPPRHRLEASPDNRFRRYPNSPVYRSALGWLLFNLHASLEAKLHLERLAADNFADLKRSSGYLGCLALLAEICAGLGNVPDHSTTLYNLLLPYAERNIVLGHVAAFGSASLYLGKLALSLNRSDDATRHFQEAVNLNSKFGARTWAAYSCFELADALLARGGSAGSDRRLALLADAGTEARTLGMNSLADRCTQALRGVTADRKLAGEGKPDNVTRDVISECPCPLVVEISVPVTSSLGKKAASGNGHSDAAIFRQEGELWTANYDGNLIHLRQSKGLLFIAHLLRHPHQEFQPVDLAAMAAPELSAHNTGHGSAESDLGPILDVSAKRSYRERIKELRENLEEARSFNDLERTSKLEEEMRFLTRELARAVGLRGRDRAPGSKAERARLRVTNAIKTTINKISKHHPSLARHFADNVKTGTFCSYKPEPDATIVWEL